MYTVESKSNELLKIPFYADKSACHLTENILVSLASYILHAFLFFSKSLLFFLIES